MADNDEAALRNAVKKVIHDIGPVLASFDFLLIPDITEEERKSIANDARATLKRLRDELKEAADF